MGNVGCTQKVRDAELLKERLEQCLSHTHTHTRKSCLVTSMIAPDPVEEGELAPIAKPATFKMQGPTCHFS
eukprot:4329054-Amphidinium_carterae.1